MSPDRIDALMEETVLTGSIPPDATPEERAELEPMLAAMGLLKASRAAVDDEARSSMSTARARFQRYVAANASGRAAPRTLPMAGTRRGFLGRLFGGSPVRALAGSAAAVGVLVLVALVVSQFAFSGAESAYAQVVQPGDYVQVEGVVNESSDGLLKLTSELGAFEVKLTENTSLVDGATAGEVSSLKPGDRVLVGGIAGTDRKLHAQTLALGQPHEGPPPRVVSFSHLQHLRADLEGQVVTFTISSDGERGAVLIDAGDGQRYLVPLDGRAAEDLLSRASTALGQQVKITSGSGVTGGKFSLDVPTGPPGSTTPPGSRPDSGRPHGHPSFVNVRGVVTKVDQRPAADDAPGVTVATVQTAQDSVSIIVRAQTRIFAGRSGLDASALPAQAVGHTVSVSGGVDKRTGSVVADVIVVGMKLER